MTLVDQSMLLFHLSDTYFFWNEMIKQQATSEAESQIFFNYLQAKKRNEKRYSRTLIAVTGVPFIGFVLVKKTMYWKVLGVYAFYSIFDAIYDVGMYVNFFVHAPSYMR